MFRVKPMGARIGVVVIGVIVLATAFPGRALGDGVFAGACTLAIRVTFDPAVGPVPGPTVLWLDGTGTCVVNGLVAPLDFQAQVATTPLTGGYSCAGGVATGTGVFQVATPGFPSPVVTVTVVDTGPAVTIVMTSLLVTFEGVASLARDTTDVTTCWTSSMTATDWTGAVVFQDPYPPPV